MSIVKFILTAIIINTIFTLTFMVLTGIGKEAATAIIIFGPVFLTWIEIKAIICVYDLLHKK